MGMLQCLSFNHLMWFVIESYLLYVNQAITRYEKEFGSLNYRFRVGQVEFIAIDAQAIDGMHFCW